MKTKTVAVAAALGSCLAAGLMIGRATADQPHMVNALASLQAARSELTIAMADKGGHRVNALRYVNSAISETQAGIDYAAGH